MKTIMVVDDMAIIREPIAKALMSHGYDVISIANGEEALAAITRRRPDLILLDMMMPRCDGLSVLRALKSNAADATIPVIMLTAADEKEGVLEAAKLGVRDYVLKSHFNLTELIKRIETRLAGPNPSAAVVPGIQDIPAAKTERQPIVLTLANEQQSVASLHEASPVTTHAKMRETLANCGELKAMSPTVSRLMEMTDSGAYSIDQIAKTIQQDQVVAVKILKLANSVIYSRGEPVDSVAKAVQRIGTAQIRQAVMNLGVVDRFGSSGGSSRIIATQFWEHSIACGLIAAEITRARCGKEAQVDQAFTMGLLHDIGKMVYMEALGDQYSQVLGLGDKLHLPQEMVESKMLVVNHAAAMEQVLNIWRFPKDLIKPIAMHHHTVTAIKRNAGDSFAESCTLALANRLAHALLLGSSGNDTIYPTDELVRALELPPQVITRIESDIPGQTDEIKFAMLSRSNQDAWPSHRAEARRGLPPVSQPIYLSKTGEIDSFRIVIDQLRQGPGNGLPNLAVLYVHKQTEADELLNDLQNAETQAGVTTLPLLILLANNKLTLDNRAMGPRRVQLLSATFRLSALLNAVALLLGPTPESPPQRNDPSPGTGV